ncbi:MAG TPA: FecR family protein [Pyrinomonadaceae bacterium]
MLSGFRKFWFFVVLWLTFLSFYAASENNFKIYAQSSAVEARVTSVSGGATLSGNGRNGARLVRGAILAPGHEIDTRGGGRVVIDLSDGSQVVVLPGSRLVVGDYRNASSLRELLQITLGRIRVRINHFKNKPNPYRIKSPTASIAVRGTEFEVNVELSGETRVVVSDGAVEVASLSDSNNPLLAEPGRAVIVRRDFTLDFFIPNLSSRNRQKNQPNDAGATNESVIRETSQAANVYERFTETVTQSGETATPSRFAAFADNYLDSLENPAYAGAFSSVAGRVYFAPSVSGAGDAAELFPDDNPVDYGIALEGGVFALLPRLRAVIGASGSFTTNGFQSFGEKDYSRYDPVSLGDLSILSKLGTTNNKFFAGSLVAARKFGSRDQTSVGFSIEKFDSNGNLSPEISLENVSGNVVATAYSTSRIARRRVTFGFKHDFGSVKFGAFYRYGKNRIFASKHYLYPSEQTFKILPETSGIMNGHSSEIGFRLRGALTNRLFYGVEGNFLLSRNRKNVEFFADDVLFQRSTETAAINRGSLSFGLGYLWRPRTIFSFDLTGGLTGTDARRSEDSTGDTLEKRARRSSFFSAHAAVQTDVWRSLFASASVLSLTESAAIDSRLFPDASGRVLNGEARFVPDGRSKNFSADFYSSFGIGWRFKPNFVFQYNFATDYGRSAPRHSFLLRYDFDFSGK